MGKTSKPLTIVALPPCDEWDELAKLEAQGHKVIRLTAGELPQPLMWDMGQVVNADLIIGANAWRMTTQHSKYLPVAIKEARMLRYDTKEYRQDVKNRQAADAEFSLSDRVQSDAPDTPDAELPPD